MTSTLLFPQLRVDRLPMAHPGDLSALAGLFDARSLRPDEVVAVIGKTEGNGGLNDYTRGFFTQSLMLLLAARLGRTAQALLRELPCILSGGTEGVLSPHYVVFSRSERPLAPGAATSGGALAIGTAMGTPLAPAQRGGWDQVRSVADAVRTAMRGAGIERAEDVRFVQVKCPFADQAMARSRAAGAFGVAVALGELCDDPALASSMLCDFECFSGRASVSAGVEVEVDEVVVLGHSARWQGTLRIASRPMRDALDIGAVTRTLRDLGLHPDPDLPPAEAGRIAAVFAKCEPDRRGSVRGARHTMLGDTDLDAQRHVRGAVGGLLAGVIGDGRLFVSGGAEHQGPDGGGLVAVIAHAA